MKHRIHPANIPILKLPEDHPARAALVAHVKCRRDCVGKEIAFSPDEVVFDHEWHSELDQRNWNLSGFLYAYVSFDLILNEWIDPEYIFDASADLNHIDHALTLLAECQATMPATANIVIHERIQQTRDFFMKWKKSIDYRMKSHLD